LEETGSRSLPSPVKGRKESNDEVALERGIEGTKDLEMGSR